MTTIGHVAVIVQSAILLGFIIVLFLRLWPAHRLDSFRQNMFCLRDELFDYAASGAIGFDNPAYKLLRQSMNGYIRYGHRLTFFRLSLTVLQWKILGQEPELIWAKKWEQSLKTVPPELRKKLQTFHTKALSLMVERVITGSPPLMLALLVLILVTLLNAGWKNFKTVCYQTASSIVSRFIDPRLLEEDAARLAA